MTGKSYRLPEKHGDVATGRVIDRSRRIQFNFDGKRLSGHPGDTVASALFANGIRLVGRSFKYHRPRGVIGSGADEPNALISVGEGARHEPNLRATQVEIYDGLVAKSQNNWPNLRFDVGQLNGGISRFIPAGFYYKTFMWPASAWMFYEHWIRRAAGLGTAPQEPDADTYEHMHARCDVLVVGGGVAGLAAAKAASASGARVMLADENPRFGGIADVAGGTIDGGAPFDWVKDTANGLAQSDNVHVLTRTIVAGHYHQNWCLLLERVSDHDPVLGEAGSPRHRLWRIRADEVILASGALERPISFAQNDRPGVMLASAARIFVERYGVSPGAKGVVFTNNDDAYRTACSLAAAGVSVPRVVDLRTNPQSPLIDAARDAGIDVATGMAVTNVETGSGGCDIKSVKIAPYQPSGRVAGREDRIDCDFVAMSGGWNPAVHLFCHTSGKVRFDDEMQTFRPDKSFERIRAVGAADGTYDLGVLLQQAYDAGESAAKSTSGPKSRPKAKLSVPAGRSEEQAPLEPVWFVPATGALNEGNKHFIDFQNDVTAADLELAVREGYRSVEHIKRYTTLGMATDQGKTSNINALGLLTDTLKSPIPQIGTTTFRPPYTPISFGAIAGARTGERFHVIRRTPPFNWHKANGADFEPVGDWRRAYCYRRGDEDRHGAINREILAVRNSVGLLDASTLGKIELKGPDAAELLDRIYSNTFSTLKIGKGRYGLMLSEEGFLSDDGVTMRLGEDHFLMHTTSGGADRIAGWLEEWLQTEWFDLQVFVTPVTEQWAQFALAGPKARDVLAKLDGDVDLSPEALEFMSMSEGHLAGYPVRVFRISFSGELSYEIATPSNFGAGLWNRLLEAGQEFGIEAYGTEALHVLRAEKGFIVVGDESDGTVTPLDLGLSWAVSKKKPDYLGKRSLQRSHLAAEGRKQLVGLLTENPQDVLPDGAYAVSEVKDAPPMNMIGQVTSSYWSPTLERSIAMALIKDGRNKMGETLLFPLDGGEVMRAKVVEPTFYDKEGVRQNV
jgi:sarcosine oxidase subunit alpha